MSPAEQTPDPGPDPGRFPGRARLSGRGRLRVVGAVLALECLALVGVVVYLVANLIGGSESETRTAGTVMIPVYFAVVAVLVALMARGVLRARSWSRAPTLLTQLIAVFGVGVPMLQGDLWYRFVLGLPLTIGATAAGLLLLTPSVTAELYDQD